MSDPRSNVKEFKVRIDVDLPPEAHERIERAVQRAVLHELAETDVADGFSVAMRFPAESDAATQASDRLGGSPSDLIGGPILEGIWIRDEPSDLL